MKILLSHLFELLKVYLHLYVPILSPFLLFVTEVFFTVLALLATVTSVAGEAVCRYHMVYALFRADCANRNLSTVPDHLMPDIEVSCKCWIFPLIRSFAPSAEVHKKPNFWQILIIFDVSCLLEINWKIESSFSVPT